MSEHFETMKEWVDSFREDVAAIKRLVASNDMDTNARKFAAASLNYVVTRMDLVPDWTETIGVLDDVMVLRVCMALASAYKLDDLDADALVTIGRMTNDVEVVEAYLGGDLYAKFKKYCARLVEETVRGRSPETIVKDEGARAGLFKDVEQDLLKMPATPFDDVEQLDLRLKSYLTAKLK